MRCAQCRKPALAVVTYDWNAEGNVKRGATMYHCMSDHCYGKGNQTDGRYVVTAIAVLPGCTIPANNRVESPMTVVVP